MVVSDSRIEIREINKRMPWLVRLDNLPTLRTLAFAVVGIASVVLTQFHTDSFFKELISVYHMPSNPSTIILPLFY